MAVDRLGLTTELPEFVRFTREVRRSLNTASVIE